MRALFLTQSRNDNLVGNLGRNAANQNSIHRGDDDGRKNRAALFVRKKILILKIFLPERAVFQLEQREMAQVVKLECEIQW